MPQEPAVQPWSSSLGTLMKQQNFFANNELTLKTNFQASFVNIGNTMNGRFE